MSFGRSRKRYTAPDQAVLERRRHRGLGGEFGESLFGLFYHSNTLTCGGLKDVTVSYRYLDSAGVESA